MILGECVACGIQFSTQCLECVILDGRWQQKERLTIGQARNWYSSMSYSNSVQHLDAPPLAKAPMLWTLCTCTGQGCQEFSGFSSITCDEPIGSKRHPSKNLLPKNSTNDARISKWHMNGCKALQKLGTLNTGISQDMKY